MQDRMDHDRLFKELIETFFEEFILESVQKGLLLELFEQTLSNERSRCCLLKLDRSGFLLSSAQRT